MKVTVVVFLSLVLISLTSCNSEINNNAISEKKYIYEFVKSYKDFLVTQKDTTKIFLIFSNTNLKKSKYYIRGVHNTLFIEDNAPFSYFRLNDSWIFIYTGLESTYYENKIDISGVIKNIKNEMPSVYNPPIWCLNVSKDTVFTDKRPLSSDIQDNTDAPNISKEKIIFRPPAGGKN